MNQEQSKQENEATPSNPIRGILTMNETEDLIPPYRCLPAPDKVWLEEKIKRLSKLFSAKDQTIAELRKENELISGFNYEREQEIAELRAEVERLKDSQRFLHGELVANMKEAQSLQALLKEARGLIIQLPCPNCQSGDGVDYHEGAGCFKHEFLTKLSEKGIQ